MKKSIGIVGGIALSLFVLSAHAQTDSTVTPQPMKTTWEAKNNPTVDSIEAKYRDKMIAARPPLTTEQIFPVLGEFESATNTDAAHIAITQDPSNKGVIWITGLPQGKIKAMLRKSPGTYKIPDQVNEEGKEVKGGTLIFDNETNNISILLGKEYDAVDPSSAFATPAEQPVAEVKVKDKGKKIKTKEPKKPATWTYTGTKLVKETAVN